MRPSRLHVIAISLASILATGACSAPEEESAAAATAEADYTSLTPEQAAMFRAVDDAIASLDRTIARLKEEVARVEAENRAKLAEIDRVVAAIAARRREVEDNYYRKRDMGFLLCAFGYCDVGAASVAMAYNDDARLQELDRELARAKAAQVASAAESAKYTDAKRKAETIHASLVERATRLRAVYQGRAEAPEGQSSPLFAGAPSLPTVAHHRIATRELQKNLEEQVGGLQSLLQAALRLSGTLDVTLGKVRAALDKVETLKRASDQEFFKLLEMVTADDPNAAARTWLEAQVKDRTKRVMRELGWSRWNATRFVDHLLAKRYPETPRSTEVTALRNELIDGLSFYNWWGVSPDD